MLGKFFASLLLAAISTQAFAANFLSSSFTLPLTESIPYAMPLAGIAFMLAIALQSNRNN